MPQFTPDDLAVLLRRLQDHGWNAILVGGQAVNVWAAHFADESAAWSNLRPFSSEDLDYHGGPAEARQAMRVLGVRGRVNDGTDPSPNAGVLTVPLADGRQITVDVLTTLYGISAAEVERTAVTLSGMGALAGLSLRIIHPLLLTEGKCASLRGLSQATRQDAKHLRILTLVLRAWLRERLADPRAVFRAIERIAACALSPDGIAAFVRGIDVTDAVPLDELRQAAGFESFVSIRWPQLKSQLDQKRQRHLDAIQVSD